MQFGSVSINPVTYMVRFLSFSMASASTMTEPWDMGLAQCLLPCLLGESGYCLLSRINSYVWHCQSHVNLNLRRNVAWQYLTVVGYLLQSKPIHPVLLATNATYHGVSTFIVRGVARIKSYHQAQLSPTIKCGLMEIYDLSMKFYIGLNKLQQENWCRFPAIVVHH